MPRRLLGSQGDDKKAPPYSYVALISMAIQDAPDKRLTVGGIHDYITKNFPHYRNRENQGWRNSIRRNLSLHECFMKLPAKSGKSHYWVLDPNHEVLFEEGRYNRRRRLRRPVKQVSYAPASAQSHSGRAYRHSHVGAAADYFRSSTWPSAFQPYPALPTINPHTHFVYSSRSMEPQRSLTTPYPPPLNFTAYPSSAGVAAQGAAIVGQCSSVTSVASDLVSSRRPRVLQISLPQVTRLEPQSPAPSGPITSYRDSSAT